MHSPMSCLGRTLLPSDPDRGACLGFSFPSALTWGTALDPWRHLWAQTFRWGSRTAEAIKKGEKEKNIYCFSILHCLQQVGRGQGCAPLGKHSALQSLSLHDGTGEQGTPGQEKRKWDTESRTEAGDTKREEGPGARDPETSIFPVYVRENLITRSTLKQVFVLCSVSSAAYMRDLQACSSCLGLAAKGISTPHWLLSCWDATKQCHSLRCSCCQLWAAGRCVGRAAHLPWPRPTCTGVPSNWWTPCSAQAVFGFGEFTGLVLWFSAALCLSERRCGAGNRLKRTEGLSNKLHMGLGWQTRFSLALLQWVVLPAFWETAGAFFSPIMWIIRFISVFTRDC